MELKIKNAIGNRVINNRCKDLVKFGDYGSVMIV